MGLDQRSAQTQGLGRWQWLRVVVALAILGLNLLFFIPFVQEVVRLANGQQEHLGDTPDAWPPYAAAAGLYAVSSVAALVVPWVRSRRRSTVWTLVAMVFWAAGVAVLVQADVTGARLI